MKSTDFLFDNVSNLSHTYGSDYPPYEIGVDDESDSYAGSKVADKAAAVSGYGRPNIVAQFGENSILYNENGDRLVLQAFYSMPLLPKHQFYRSDSRIDSALYSQISRDISNSPTVNKGSSGKIQFRDVSSRNAAITAVSKAITAIVPKENLSLYSDRYPIYWINPSELSSNKALTFGISHWMFIPNINKEYPNTYAELERDKLYSNQIKHYFFGYVDSVGIPTTGETDLMSKFQVGTIEKVMRYYGIGTNSLKRLSALKPSRVLGMNATGGYDGQYELKALDNSVTGKILRDPYNELYNAIKTAYGSNPTKANSLTKVTEQIIGKDVNSPISYPIKIENISYNTTGFTTGAISVDYMELLHPLLIMKKNGVINNGVYNAAQAFLSESGEDGRHTFNLSQCAVAYPDAANAKLFDSMLINPKTGGRILISSKANEGAAPSAASLGSVWSLLSKDLERLQQVKIANPEFNNFILQDTRTRPEFKELLAFFSALAGEKGREDRVNQLMPKDPYAKKLAERMLAKDSNISMLLNTWNGGNSYASSGKGAFLKYCSTVMRFTPLIQANTIVEHDNQKEIDEIGSITIKGVMATWPNKIFDDIEFLSQGDTLRFKISVGGAEGIVSTRQSNVRDAEGRVTTQRVYTREPNWNAWKGRDYDGKMTYRPRYTYTSKINKMNVPGFDGTWNKLVNRLSREYEMSLLGNDEVTARVIKEIRPLYQMAIKFVQTYGHDPGMSGKSDLTTRELLDRIGKLLA